MSRTLLAALATAAFVFSNPVQAHGTAESTDTSHQAAHPHGEHHKGAHHQGAHHHEKMHQAKPTAEMITEFEARLGKMKDAGASLPADLKAELDYNLKIAAIEIETLKDPNIKNHNKHAASLSRGLNASESILKKHEHMAEREKKMEDRKAEQEKKALERKSKDEERKARADKRKAEGEARKAEREAKKAAAKGGDHHHKMHEMHHGKMMEHKAEGADKAAHESGAAMPTTEEKK